MLKWYSFCHEDKLICDIIIKHRKQNIQHIPRKYHKHKFCTMANEPFSIYCFVLCTFDMHITCRSFVSCCISICLPSLINQYITVCLVFECLFVFCGTEVLMIKKLKWNNNSKALTVTVISTFTVYGMILSFKQNETDHANWKLQKHAHIFKDTASSSRKHHNTGD